MAYKIVVEVGYFNSSLGSGLLKHTNNIELPHVVPAEFKEKFQEETGQDPSYAAYKEAVLRGVVNSWGSENRSVVLSADDGNEHTIIDRADVEYVKIEVVKTLDKG